MSAGVPPATLAFYRGGSAAGPKPGGDCCSGKLGRGPVVRELRRD